MKAAKEEFRALSPFKSVLSNHLIFKIEDDGSEPHLRRGENAIVDTQDRAPANGELYLIRFNERGRFYVKQLKTANLVVDGPNAAPSLVWWICDLRGFRKTDKRAHSVPLFAGLSDGPYKTDGLASIVVGRIVGYADGPLAQMLNGKTK